MPRKNAKQAAAAALKESFDIESFKKRKLLKSNVKFKEQEWIPVSEAFSEVLSLKGIPKGHITVFRGHTDTGKTTALIETAVSAQKMGILPVFIITEMKWNWEHLSEMGFQLEPVVDKDTGEVTDYSGFFLYKDRETLKTIEDVASFILDILKEQEKGELPCDLLFLWDSVGSIPCKMSVEKSSNNNEWNAGAMSTQFGNNINQLIPLSRKESQPYTNTFVCINKVWTKKPDNPMGQPKMMNKGGWTMWYDATLQVTFGNVSDSGTSKLKATKDGKTVEYARVTNVQVEKIHAGSGTTTRGKLVMTPHGFVQYSDSAIKKYKEDHRGDWSKKLGWDDFDIVVEEDSE